jgi:hypothetical protein
MKVSRQIMKEVVAAGARFLKKNTGSHDWYVADIKVGKDKISHCLREIKNRKSRHACAQYRPDPPVPPAPPAAILSGAHHMTAHRTGQLLYEAQGTNTQQWNQGTRPEAGTVHSISPFPVSPSNILPGVQPAVASEHEYRPIAAAAGSSAELLQNTGTSAAPAAGSYAGAWEAAQQVSNAQNQDLLDFANNFSKTRRQQSYGGSSWKHLHNYDDQKEAGAQQFFSIPSWTTEYQQSKLTTAPSGTNQDLTHLPSPRKPPPWTGHRPRHAVAYHPPPRPASAPSAEQPHPTVQPDAYCQWPPVMQQRAFDQQSLPSSDLGDSRWSTPPSNDDNNFANIFSDFDSTSPRLQQQQYQSNHHNNDRRNHDYHNNFRVV